jgi:hypothetical protein
MIHLLGSPNAYESLGLCESCMFVTIVSPGTNWVALGFRGLLIKAKSSATNTGFARCSICLRTVHEPSSRTGDGPFGMGPLGGRLHCVDRVCDARPATYIHGRLQTTASRFMHGRRTGHGTSRRVTLCSQRPRGRVLNAFRRGVRASRANPQNLFDFLQLEKQIPDAQAKESHNAG